MNAASRPTVNTPTGQVRLRLTVADGGVRQVALAVERPAVAARQLLTGKPVAEALKLVRLLFPVCAMAQQTAAIAAAEQALGVTAAAEHQTARDLLTTAEALSGHIQHLALDWPQAAGAPPQPMALVGARRALAKLPAALYPDGDSFALGGGRLAPDGAALLAILDIAADSVRQLVDAPHALLALPDPPTPVRQPYLLPDHDAAWFARRLAADAGFAEHPDDDGRPALTGPLAAQRNHPDVAALLRHSGVSVFSLYAARLVSLVYGMSRLVELCRTVAFCPPRRETIFNGGGEGCGIVHAARGVLAHWLRIERGVIADWRAVAPTEWNFHPQGPLANALLNLPAGPDLSRRAEILVCAMDPCVPWRIEIHEESADA